MRPPAYGILYAEDFDDPAPPGNAEPEPEVVEPSFTLAELDAARTAARADGVASERARLGAETDAARARALDALTAALAEAGEVARAVAEDAADGLAQAVLSVVAAGLPALCAQHGEGEVRALLGALLPTLAVEPRITVRLSPHLLDPVRADLAALDPDIAAAVQLVPTDAVPLGDVRVSWDGGSLQRSATAACAAVREALAPLGLLLPDPAPLPAPSRTLEIADVR